MEGNKAYQVTLSNDFSVDEKPIDRSSIQNLKYLSVYED